MFGGTNIPTDFLKLISGIHILHCLEGGYLFPFKFGISVDLERFAAAVGASHLLL